MQQDLIGDSAAGGTPERGSDPIEAFYTRHPYPPPVDNLDRARDEWRDPNRARAEFHLFWPHAPYRDDLDILVAGCGTWQAAKYALCHPKARIVGIDVSTTSLDHTERLKRQYNLANLDVQQVPIEHVAALDRQFDLIVCTGVLHHLADPDAGLRALRSVLRPDGAIYLMVYARFGRAGIYMLQDYCRRLGIGTSPQEIGDLVATLDTLPRHHPLMLLLSGSRDVRNADALADALLNPRDQSYSVPELFALLDRSGLRFGRWYGQAPYLAQCGAIATTPHAKRLAALPAEQQYAAIELWRGTMTAHSVIASRSDASRDRRNEHFGDGRWLRAVPVRRPSTLCVQERLPAGAAGVLLNRSHRFPDLVLPISEQEKQMFDRIDGRRTIGDIIERPGDTGAHARARTFFERLWWYDQVVLDTAGT